MSRTVTIYLGPEDPDIKQMIRDLKKSRQANNPYVGRSESEIAKMILQEELARQHERICRSADEPSSRGKGAGHAPGNRRS